MSSTKQKHIENARYPHVKRNWIKAIKAIRGGKISSKLHLVEHQSGLDANQKRQRIAQDTGGWIAHPDPKHWLDNHSAAQVHQQEPTTECGTRRVFSKLIF